MNDELTTGSICAGIGGFDLAFERLGVRTKWYSEIDPQCCRLLADKYPNARSVGDIVAFKPDPKRDSVDIVAAGSPCQDLSVAGKRAGLDGERSGLFYQMVRVCKRLRPSIVLWENVPGAFSSSSGNDFAAVIRAFTGLKVEVPLDGWANSGFVRTPFPLCRWHVAWRVLDAQYFGLAQRRERLFLVASLGNARCVEILFEPESLCWNHPPSRETGQRIAPTISARTEVGGGQGTDFEVGGGLSRALRAQPQSSHRADSETFIPVISNCLNGRGGVGRIDAESETFICGPLQAHSKEHGHAMSTQQAAESDQLVTAYRTAGNCGPFEQGDKTGAMNTATDPSQNIVCFKPQYYTRANNPCGMPSDISATLGSGKRNQDSQQCLAFTERTRADGRSLESQEDLAYALTNPGSGGRTHSRQIAQDAAVRRLTPTEAERLQGFPDGYTASFSDSARYRMLGNSVAVPVVEWIAKRIVNNLNPQ